MPANSPHGPISFISSPSQRTRRTTRAVVIGAALAASLATAGAAAGATSASGQAVVSRSPTGTVGWQMPTLPAGAGTLTNTADRTPERPGTATVIKIANPAAPTSYASPLNLPGGSTAALAPDGSVSIREAGRPVGSFRPPWARDAAGQALSTHYVLTGDATAGYVLTQVVSTVGATFPVTADPHYTWGYVTGTIYFNRSETDQFAFGTGLAGTIASFAPPWGSIVGAYLGALSAEAGLASISGQCVALKSTGSAEIYSGSQGDGYCT
jgi:hypothetical protein